MHSLDEVQAHRTSSNLLELHSQAHRTSLNLLELHSHRDSKVYRLLSHKFGMVRLDRTFSNYISSGDTRCAGCNMHQFGEVQPQRTSSNLLELHPHRASKVFRLPLHEFGVVRLNRTFSDCIFTGDRRSEGALCQKAPCTPSSPCKAVVREGSVQSNHPELV